MLLTSTESTTNLSHKSHCISKEMTLRAIRDITQLHRHHYNTVPTWTEIEADLEEDESKASIKGQEMRSVPATSQIFIVTFPFLTFRKLKATVGTTSSLHCQGRYDKNNTAKRLSALEAQMNDHKNRPHLSGSNHIDKRSFS